MEAIQALHETAPVGAAPELAVVHDLQADLFLQLHGIANRLVLDAVERCVIDAPRAVITKGLLQRRRAQQAADVIGAERRRHPPMPVNRRTTSSWMSAASTISAIGTDSLAA
jgi:hypothetical protein